MTDKEIAEIRRRYKTDKSSISRVRGCYVNDKREIISKFDQSIGLMTEDEAEELWKKRFPEALEKIWLILNFQISRYLKEMNMPD